MLEVVGVLGNLTIPDLDYELLLTEYNLIPWINKKLQPGGWWGVRDEGGGGRGGEEEREGGEVTSQYQT